MKFLVTGFPPYDQFKTNSSQILIDSMVQDLPGPLADYKNNLVFEMVDFDNTTPKTQRQTMTKNLLRLLNEYQPDACLFCGQGFRRSLISLEKIAINISMGPVIEPDGPPAYWSTLPNLEQAVRLLKDDGIPAKLSFHAGVHLCNHILYAALHYAHTNSQQIKCGFMHVPLTEDQAIEMGGEKPFMSLKMSRNALTILILHVIGCMI